MKDELVDIVVNIHQFNQDLTALNIKQAETIEEQKQEIERLKDSIKEIDSIYQSLCFSAPENNYVFIEKLGKVLQELKGSDRK